MTTRRIARWQGLSPIIGLWIGAVVAQAAAVRCEPDGTVVVSPADGAEFVFRPAFVAVHAAATSPPVSVKLTHPVYNLAGVKQAGRTVSDVFAMGEVITLETPAVEHRGGAVHWRFEHPGCELDAEVIIPPDGAEPRIRATLTARQAGMWTFAYAGAPAARFEEVVELFQPLVWSCRRMPTESFLVSDDICSIPGCLVETPRGTVGVLADPAQFPFEMPVASRRRFGATVRNSSGQAQPHVFAPFPGMTDASLQVGDSRTTTVVLVARTAPLDATFEHVARSVCGFRDRREHTLASLNTAFDAILDFATGATGGFDAEHRAFSYPDSTGTVKNVSALHPVCLAYVTDDESLFRGVGMPVLEYLLSREKFLFALAPDVTGSQVPSRKLAGPAMPVSELAAFQRLSAGATPYFGNCARRLHGIDRTLNIDWVSPGNSWQNDLWLYRATGDRQWLDAAHRKADAGIAKQAAHPPTDFAAAGTGTFFDSMLPPWKDFYELWLETRDAKHLAAAHTGARQYARLVWFYPAVPEGTVTVNQTGFAPRRGRPDQDGLVRVAPETVPAWRVSEQGLVCEGNGTVQRIALYLATHAPLFMRLSHDCQDPFLRDIARSAIVGRFAGFPGYHFNTRYSTAQEKGDFASHPFDELKVTTSMHYNHSLPMANLVLDYLFSDAYARSRGAIEFPAEFAEGYAYLGGRVYGGPGRFYDRENVHPWMPKGLLTTDDVQVDFVAGRSDEGLHVALMNQCDRDLEAVTIRLDTSRFEPPRGPVTAVVWCDGERSDTPVPVRDGSVTVPVSARGITALAIDGLIPRVRFQTKCSAHRGEPPRDTFTAVPMTTGTFHAIRLSFGPDLTWLYAYLEGGEHDVSSVKLVIDVDGTRHVLSDDAYPFEFTLPLPYAAERVSLALETLSPHRESVRSELIRP